MPNAIAQFATDRRSFMSGLLGAVLPLPAAGAAFRSDRIDDRADRAASAIEAFVATGIVPGGVVSFGDRSGRVAHRPVGMRWKGGPAMSADTIFRLYCMSKPIAAMAFARAIEKGLVGLDDPLAVHMPEFARMTVLEDAGERPAGGPILVRHLMSHTAGFTMPIVNTGELPDRYMRLGLVASRIELPDVNRLIQSRPEGLAEFASRLATLPLASDPGARFEYGESYDLLGALVERRAGMSYSRWLDGEILRPLGMKDTGFVIPEASANRIAGTYWVMDGGRSVRIDEGGKSLYLKAPPFEDAGNGLVSSPADACRFARSLLSGRGPVSASTMDRMMTDALLPGDTTGRFGPAGDPGYGYGWGGYVRRAGAKTPQSEGTFGWGGFGGAYFWVDRRAGFYCVLMCQFAPAGEARLRTDVTARAYA